MLMFEICKSSDSYSGCPKTERSKEEIMTITKSGQAPEVTIALEGRLDTTTAPDLEKEVQTSLEGVKSLTFDLNALEYISSAGLRVLLSAQKIMNKQGEMTIVGANDAIMEVFEVTGFVDILNIA